MVKKMDNKNAIDGYQHNIKDDTWYALLKKNRGFGGYTSIEPVDRAKDVGNLKAYHAIVGGSASRNIYMLRSAIETVTIQNGLMINYGRSLGQVVVFTYKDDEDEGNLLEVGCIYAEQTRVGGDSGKQVRQ